jgi:hypothetical protein
MASTNCVEILQGIDPNCDALNKRGGINKRVWIGQLSQLTGFTKDSDGYINTVTLAVIASIQQTLKKFIGKKFKHAATFEGVVGENVNTINQSLALSLYYSTPAERGAIEALFNADDVFAFVEGNYGGIEVYGIELGLNGSALTGGLQTLLNDNTAVIVTLSGEQESLPLQFKTGTLAQDIAYLDGISA